MALDFNDLVPQENTSKFDTRLNPQEESSFKSWKQKYAPKDSGADYDLRGAYKEGLKPDPKTGHWPDTYKKPNHPTFSDQSKYAKDAPDKAGRWEGETYIPPKSGGLSFDDLVPKEQDTPLHAAGRSFVESIPSAAAGLAGFGAGMSAAAPAAATAGAMSGPAAPIVAGAIELAGGLAGAFTASGGAEWVTEKLHALMAPEDYAKRQQEKKDNPNATMVGSIGANLLGLSPKTAPEIAGKFLTKPLVQRGATGALMGGITAGEQAVKGEFDPKEIAISAATGVVMPGFNAAGKVLVGTGERIVSAAFRRKSNGKIIPSDDKHDLEKKTDPDLEQGFLDEQGEFLTRMEAAKKAKESGQIPPEKELGRPDEGLHTGDLKKAADKEVDIPKVPKTRQEHKIRLGELDSDLQSLAYAHEEAVNTKDAEFQKQVEAKIEANLKQQEELKKAMPAPEVKDKAYPTLEEGKDILWGVKTIGEALETLYKGGYGSMGAGLLAKLLTKSKFGMEAKFRFTDTELSDPNDPNTKWAGMYDPNTHEVVMNGVTNDIDKMRFMRDILHEATHATSHALLHDLHNPHGKRIRELYRYVSNNLEPNIIKHEDGSESIFYPDHYGLTNEHEFVSEAFTNPKFQKMLQDMVLPDIWQKVGKKESVWQQFKNAVRRGIEEFTGDKIEGKAHTALDEALDIGSHIVEAPKEESLKAIRDYKTSSAFPAEVKAVAAGIDPRSIANEEEFNKHAEQIYHTEGKDAAIEFFKAWKQEQKDRAIPVPKNRQELDDALHKIQTWTTKDSSEFARKHQDNTKEGMTPELREKFFRAREGEVKLTPEETVQMQKLLAEGDKEVQALIQKVRKLSGDDRAFREFETGQARYRLFTPRERSWKDFWGSKDNALLENMADDASATRERSVFQLEDGRVVQTYRVGDGSMLYEWKNGKRSRNAIAMSEHGKTFTAGDTAHIDGKDVKITDGQVHNIEQHSPYRYLKDAEATQYMKLMELRKNARDLELMDNLKKDGFFGMGKGPDTPLHEIPKGYRVPNNIDKIPQLRGWMFDSKTAAIIEDFAKVWDSTMWMKLTNQLVKNMMLNPLPHMLNEVAHLWNFRGLSGWVTPKGLSSFAKLGKEAWIDVSTQSQFYRDVMKEGGSVLGADPRNNQYWSQIMKDGGEAVWGKPQVQSSIKSMAQKFGFGAMDFYNAWSKNSQKAMWFSRDVMYVQAIREVMARNERRGTPVTLKEAVAQAERHMPNYRMPSEVLGSRGVAEILKNPNISLFSRYHYGMVKSLVETMKEINPKNLSTVKGRGEFKDGLDSILAIGVAMTVMYPLMDMLAEEVFGKGAKQRRAGPFHMIEAIEDVTTGKKDASALVWPVFTFNPMLLTMAQLVYNKQLFSGKPIFHPEDKAGDIASDVGTYLAKQVPQVSTGMKATNEDFGTGALAKQVDVQVQSPQTQAKAKKAAEMRERNKKTRERKRLKGTYTP